MNCPKCGWSNPDDATKCANCFAELTPAQPQPTQQMSQQPPQQPYGQQPYGQPAYGQPAQDVPDYLVWSIVITVVSLFCCWFLPVSVAFGIVAIVKSSAANNKKAMGDYYGALQDANAAKTWLWWAAGIDIAALIASIAVFVIGLTMGGMSSTRPPF